MRRPGLPRWLSPRNVAVFFALQVIGSYLIALVSFGLGLVAAVIVGAFVEIPWYFLPFLFLGVLLLTTGISAIVIHSLVPDGWIQPQQQTAMPQGAVRTDMAEVVDLAIADVACDFSPGREPHRAVLHPSVVLQNGLGFEIACERVFAAIRVGESSYAGGDHATIGRIAAGETRVAHLPDMEVVRQPEDCTLEIGVSFGPSNTYKRTELRAKFYVQFELAEGDEFSSVAYYKTLMEGKR